MGREVYITRKKEWFESGTEKNIPLDDWMSFVKNDPDMRLDNFTMVKLENGEMFKYDNPGTAAFLHRKCGEMEVCEIIFEYISGNIRVNDPDTETMEKIKHIAFKLNAHVQAESEAETEEIELTPDENPKPAFSFDDILNPFKKIIHKLDPGTNDNTVEGTVRE
jgi:hypothetical protein